MTNNLNDVSENILNNIIQINKEINAFKINLESADVDDRTLFEFVTRIEEFIGKNVSDDGTSKQLETILADYNNRKEQHSGGNKAKRNRRSKKNKSSKRSKNSRRSKRNKK
tara:strand:- start:65 stop:397 length:333 start_codon:yes stop_codon:yes gene_type:complete